MAVDIDVIATDLNNKADKDLANVDDSKSILVDSYKDGDSFYRVYSDGWCVQGGYLNDLSAAAYRTITLLKPYPDTTYNIQLSGVVYGAGYAGNAYMYNLQVSYKTEVDFQIFSHTYATIAGKQWLACGYLNNLNNQ